MSKPNDSKKEPEADGEDTTAKKTPIVVHIIVFLLITAAAAGAGFGASMFLKTSGAAMEIKAHEDGAESNPDDMSHGKADNHGKDGDDKQPADGPVQAYATPLAPILTNLAAPTNVWIRLELAIVAKDTIPDELLEKIHQDLFAYMRTVKLHHMEGPSGFINLKAELMDRASTRSGGAVKNILVRSLVIE